MKYKDGQPNFTPVCAQCKKPSPKARPYGPGQSLICYECGHNPDTPEITAIAAMYEREAIRVEIETKLEKLKAIFPEAKIFQVSADEIAEFMAPSDTTCDCAVCAFSRSKQPLTTQH